MDPKRLAEQLSASAPEVVASALAELERGTLRRPVVPVPMPRAGVLDVFGDPPPEEVVTSLVAVQLDYPLFDPPADDDERMAAALEVALPFGPGQPAYEVARFVRASRDAPSAVEELMRLLLDADVEDPAGLDAVAQILDLLLEAERTHDATVLGLHRWAFRGRYVSVIEDLGAALSDAERDRIRQAGD